MKSPILLSLGVFSFFGFLLTAACPNSSVAQWHSDSTHNTPVCTASGQQDNPKGCTDGADGAIIAWEDARSSTYQIYAQHLDAAGKATWAANGVKLTSAATGSYPQTMPVITTDDSGGAYVVWLDGRFSSAFGTCLFAQHIRADGSLAYADTALPVAIGLNGCANPTLCDDGRGGAYVAWEDNRTSFQSSRPDIWMNRLWPGGVKFGLATTGTTGVVKTVDEGTWWHHIYVTFLYDTSAVFQPYMTTLHLNIVGKGSYVITKASGDTLFLPSSSPSGTYAYSIPGLTGLPLDTFQNKQTGPSITSDGTGGCYLAWTNAGVVPNGIFATRIDSTGAALWDPAPGPGFLIYKSQNTANPSKNVWINRDGDQLMLTWEVTNSENSSQEVYAQRMRNSSLYDTAMVWSNTAIDVSSNEILDQTSPRIYGDDSTVLGARGALVPFLDQQPGSSDDLDIAMVRVEGDGGTLLPQAGNGFWLFDQKPHTQSGMRSVKITDDSDGRTGTGILAVWNDAWDGADTMVYAQRIDRVGRKYFPTPGTSNRWGLAISGDSSPTRRWTAKQVCLIPRGNNAGIAAWTDFRNGNADIYAQLILGDGIANIPTDLDPPVSTVLSHTGSYDGSICNSRCTDVLTVDTGSLATGINSIFASSATNMKVTVPTFTPGTDSVPYNVCVIDSLLDGSASIATADVAGNDKTVNVAYCTIPDTLAPAITWDSGSAPNWITLHFRENRPWDRGIRSITALDTVNVYFNPPLPSLKLASKSFDVTVSPIDPTQPSSFAIQASDTVGNVSPVDSFVRGVAGVASTPSASVSFSIFPNPASGAALLSLVGAPAADASIYDMLGREVAHFHIAGSYEWKPSALPPGTYYVRANIGGVIISKSIVRE